MAVHDQLILVAIQQILSRTPVAAGSCWLEGGSWKQGTPGSSALEVGSRSVVEEGNSSAVDVSNSTAVEPEEPGRPYTTAAVADMRWPVPTAAGSYCLVRNLTTETVSPSSPVEGSCLAAERRVATDTVKIPAVMGMVVAGSCRRAAQSLLSPELDKPNSSAAEGSCCRAAQSLLPPELDRPN